MSHAIEVYTNPSGYPTITVPQHAIVDAVRRLDKIPAIKLIRASYRDGDGNFATLEDAVLIYDSITNTQTMWFRQEPK